MINYNTFNYFEQIVTFLIEKKGGNTIGVGLMAYNKKFEPLRLKRSNGTHKCIVFVDSNIYSKTVHGRHVSNEKAWQYTDLGHAGKQNTQSMWKWNRQCAVHTFS